MADGNVAMMDMLRHVVASPRTRHPPPLCPIHVSLHPPSLIATSVSSSLFPPPSAARFLHMAATVQAHSFPDVLIADVSTKIHLRERFSKEGLKERVMS